MKFKKAMEKTGMNELELMKFIGCGSKYMIEKHLSDWREDKNFLPGMDKMFDYIIEQGIVTGEVDGETMAEIIENIPMTQSDFGAWFLGIDKRYSRRMISAMVHGRESISRPLKVILPYLQYSHNNLVGLAKKWLQNQGCGYVVSELKSMCMEIPDAFGLRADRTILVECKTSRSDFLKDAKKPFRINPNQGIGDFRFYLCPENLIHKEDLPEKWGLLWYDGKKIKKIHAPKGNVWNNQEEFRHEKSMEKEYCLIYSILRRLNASKR